MTQSTTLRPVSFHLRNFNKYLHLDLEASAKGNLTLVGENAAGKTTLANCFFPMLVDGSIATPSFNPAKGTDRLDKTGSARNSSRESRNFDSMLLGWGPSAMLVRTGYTYMVLQSATRQVIMGLGAHRAVGEHRKPTWWFIAINPDLQTPMTLNTTDEQGNSLEKDAFIAANAAWGDQLHVFTQVEGYRSYAAEHVYGFTRLESLNQLATAYRLLASPILTAGNARFTPIQAALKNAQEGIDRHVIENVAATQRQLNQTNALHERIVRGQDRLKRLKAQIFWRNLNRFQEIILKPYSQAVTQLTHLKQQREEIQRQLQAAQQQLHHLEPLMAQADADVSHYVQAKAVQDDLKARRKSLQNEFNLLTERLQHYRRLTDRLAQQQASLQTFKDQQATLTQQQATIRQTQLEPLRAKLAAKTAGMPTLLDVMTATDDQQLSQDLKHYLRDVARLVTQYQDIQENQQHLSEDVQIVGDMQTSLDQRIDHRAQGPLVSRFREGLHADNREVHAAGAAKMNARFDELERQRVALLRDHPDLKAYLADIHLIDALRANSHALADCLDQLATCHRQLEALAIHLKNATDQVHQTKSTLATDFRDFVMATVQADLQHLQQQLTELVLDPQIDQKLATARATFQKYRAEEQHLSQQLATYQANLTTNHQQLTTHTQALDQLTANGQAGLADLRPYASDAEPLADLTAALAFVKSHGSEVRSHSYSDLTNQIGHLIHRNDENGVDRYALDSLFEERGHDAIASAMRQQHAVERGNLGFRVVAFDLNQAQEFLATDEQAVANALAQTVSGNDVAQRAYLGAAIHQIADQYRLIDGYNDILARGVRGDQEIRLKISLAPVNVDQAVIDEACDAHLTERPALTAEVEKRLTKLASDVAIANDDDQFMDEAYQLLDIRQWSEFKIWIHRRQSPVDAFEEVDDKFVQSGGFGAEKAQAMVLPLLLVPKMILQRSRQADVPHLVMFDEFADKLDPETAKSFAQTIDHFGFNFIATMPSGAQNKVLADGVENIAYDVIAPTTQEDGRFHKNIVRPALVWQARTHD
ncbi:chromosome partitioning protein ParA [Levilactobacillus namurensis]|uniref:chromosome partitioning protein ParA n=1 Tax=Levilactobacillus namurensis TaxID=380393 RepID=UPI00223280C8|nr:chromosome partitioning protein ParA [Levilactobacillus namurensis]MCW3777312.1 chromosome partitioning protein ParA [Levilactobacillus namurensis]MDT7018622.1 chromosome partitioning protein ParA [Levilactobacillus namurensis]WNN64399.1 chromosome partitioning protein ParA [Levilactobacillus namurensis]